jgi:ankyrin repeat protein
MKKFLYLVSMLFFCNVWLFAMESGKQSGPQLHAGETQNECVICYESYADLDKENREPQAPPNSPSKVRATMPCGHMFHIGCIKEHRDRLLLEQALRSEIPCPYCRAAVPVNGDSPQVKKIRRNNRLKEAVCAGDVQAVQSFIEQGVDLTARYSNDCTLLHYAVLHQQVEMIEFLLSYPEVLEQCLNMQTSDDFNADDFISIQGGSTPLHCAASIDGIGHIIRLLINAGADVNIKNKYGNTAFLRSVKCFFDTAVCDIFLANEQVLISEPDRVGMTPLMAMMRYEPDDFHVQIISQMIQKGAGVDARIAGTGELGFTCLKTDVNLFNGATALHIAAAFGFSEYINILLDAGADINAADEKGLTPLMMAVAWNQLDSVVLLLEHGARVDCILKQETVIENNKEMFLQRTTALHIASCRACIEIMEVLLSHGADRGYFDFMGDRPFDIAQQLGRDEQVLQLLRYTRERRERKIHDV